jgi:molybdate transport system substrate-binding protein
MVATRRRAFARAGLVGALLALVVSPGDAPAAELAVFSAGAMEPGLRRLIPAFERETGQAVRLTIAVPNVLRHRVEAGERPDVLIAPPPVVDALTRAGLLRSEPLTVIGRVGVAVVVREGAPVPDVSTPDALRRALLESESLVFNRASTGTYFEKVLERLGISDAVRARTTRYPDGNAVMEHVIRGTGREIGIGPITEIRPHEAKGLRFVGPLPASIQNYTAYLAGVLAKSPAADRAAGFIRHITTPAARAEFAVTGVE